MRSGPDSELSVRTATNLAITLRKLHRYGDEFPLRVRVLEATRRARWGPTTSKRPWRWSSWPRRSATSATTRWR